MIHIVLKVAVGIAVGTSFLSATPTSAADDGQKAVLITGASTGIGRKTATLLAANGYFVYAGARKQSDLDALNAIENVKSVRLDVTIQADIDAAVKTVSDDGRGLHGLVNNAGVAIAGPLIEVSEDELRWLFDVNVYGPYRVTKAFAPLIIESRGRITMISSIAGILSGEFLGQYSMSKHAIEAYSDSLAQELARFGVQVSVIEPGSYRSALSDSAFRRMAAQNYTAGVSLFAEDYSVWLERQRDRQVEAEPDDVAQAVMHSLFDREPRRRYLVVPNRQEAGRTIRQAIRELIQLNSGHDYSYDREELIAIVDEEMGISR